MTRLIEIFYDDKKEHIEMCSADLPLKIYFIQEERQLLIAPLNENSELLKSEQAKKEQTKKEQEKKIFGYIAEEDNHLFFQPDEDGISGTIFHNDEIIKKSVWLKSGDIIQIEKMIIIYSVSGDKVLMTVTKKPEAPVIIPPLNSDKYNNNINNQQQKTSVLKDFEMSPTKPDSAKNKIAKYKLIPVLLVLLMLAAGFVLFAQTVVINIKPEADSINLKGFLPAIKIDQRYIMLSGKYILEAEKVGYKTLSSTLDINAENNDFSFTMKETPGIIQFDINPEQNNEIYIDDILLAHTSNEMTLRQYEVDKGVHNVRIINPRYKAYEQKIKVEGKNQQQKYKIKLQQNWGIARLESSQKETKIIITSASDNKSVVYDNVINGVTEIELITGQYTIHATKEKFKEKTEQVTIKAGDKLSLKPFELEPEDGILHLSSIPSQSIIRVDDQYLGKTPQTLKLSPYQEHTIELSLQGFETTKKIVKLEPEISIEEEFKLTAKKGLVFISVSPKHADLYIDGKKQKENSGKFNLTNKNHLLKVQAKGYQTQSKKITINAYSKNISFILKKNSVKKSSASVTKTVNKKNDNKNHSGNNKNYRNIIKQKMILVQPALFKMGSRKNEAGRSSNESEHKIQLNYAYYLSEKEISNKQYRQFKKSHNSGSTNNESLNLNNQPVVNVSWQDAARFANWLSKRESIEVYYKEEYGKMSPVDINADNKGYRLPFEAEWVLAARGKNQKKYSWNGNYPPINGSGNFADDSASTHITNTISGYNDQQSVSATIGSYAKNEMGFYDLGGNVSEWCQDYYSPTSGQSGNKVSLNPKGPKKGKHKVVRDASWRDASITELRLSYRSYSKKKANDIGFRLARYAQ